MSLWLWDMYLWTYDYEISIIWHIYDIPTYRPMTVRYLWNFDYDINLWHTCAYIWDSVTSCHKVRKSILYKTELKNIYLWKEFSANTVSVRDVAVKLINILLIKLKKILFNFSDLRKSFYLIPRTGLSLRYFNCRFLYSLFTMIFQVDAF